ncbi:hypothetical protein [uncultured Erythrobacter sp.]|uniref:hypothetical protein n=1 Tax=uncultured Erythrobacter sp. TaxID=263913 RepID=UPI00261A4C1D|nr:hypothetical protein [uncultured Erythrobacter sp.]
MGRITNKFWLWVYDQLVIANKRRVREDAEKELQSELSDIRREVRTESLGTSTKVGDFLRRNSWVRRFISLVPVAAAVTIAFSHTQQGGIPDWVIFLVLGALSVAGIAGVLSEVDAAPMAAAAHSAVSLNNKLLDGWAKSDGRLSELRDTFKDSSSRREALAVAQQEGINTMIEALAFGADQETAAKSYLGAVYREIKSALNWKVQDDFLTFSIWKVMPNKNQMIRVAQCTTDENRPLKTHQPIGRNESFSGYAWAEVEAYIKNAGEIPDTNVVVVSDATTVANRTKYTPPQGAKTLEPDSFGSVMSVGILQESEMQNGQEVWGILTATSSQRNTFAEVKSEEELQRMTKSDRRAYDLRRRNVEALESIASSARLIVLCGQPPD